MIGFYNYTVILTYLSAVSATLGLIFAAKGEYCFAAIICLMISGICDMFDGMVAKTRERTKQEKRFGIWIDSLADVIAFGVVPAMIGYSFGMTHWGYAPIIAAFVLAAIIRLAYYGVTEEERQDETNAARTQFVGLPVTSSALIFPFVYAFHGLVSESVFTIIYAAVLGLTALAFVGRFRVKKFVSKELFILLGLGVVIFAAILIVRFCALGN